jgi:nitroreductase
LIAAQTSKGLVTETEGVWTDRNPKQEEYMELLKEIGERRAFRALETDALPDESLKNIIAAGTMAPSCFNNQPWRVVASRGASLEALKASLSEGNVWATRAPVILAVAVKESDDCRLEDGRDYALFDAGLCAMNMIIQATAEGLVAHPIAGYNPKKAKAALGIPADHILITLIIVARKGELEGEDASLLKEWQVERDKGDRQRKPVGETAFLDSWGQGWA